MNQAPSGLGPSGEYRLTHTVLRPVSVSEPTVGQRLCARWIGAYRMDGEDSTVELRSTVGHGQGAGARLRQAKRSKMR